MLPVNASDYAMRYMGHKVLRNALVQSLCANSADLRRGFDRQP